MIQQQTTQPLAATGDAFYIETSLPAGLTISAYRRQRPRRPSVWQRLKEVAGGAAMTPACAR